MQQHSAASDVVQVALPTAYVGALVYGLSLQDWVWILTIALLLLQIPYFAWTKIISPALTKRRIRKADNARRRTRRVVAKLDTKRENDVSDD